MMKKVFMGIAILNEDNEVVKSLGIMKDLHDGKIEKINTENLSDESSEIMIERSNKLLSKSYLKEVIKIDKTRQINEK